MRTPPRDQRATANQPDACSLFQFPTAIDRPEIVHGLKRAIRRLVRLVHLREDFLQETMLHCWRIMSQQPNKPLHWYLQTSQFHIRDLLKRGRSIDSPKNNDLRRTLQDNLEILQLVSGDDVIRNVSLSDLVCQLSSRLIPPDTHVLSLLTEGNRLSEIAQLLRLPRREVSRSRARIAQVAASLDLNPRSKVKLR